MKRRNRLLLPHKYHFREEKTCAWLVMHYQDDFALLVHRMYLIWWAFQLSRIPLIPSPLGEESISSWHVLCSLHYHFLLADFFKVLRAQRLLCQTSGCFSRRRKGYILHTSSPICCSPFCNLRLGESTCPFTNLRTAFIRLSRHPLQFLDYFDIIFQAYQEPVVQNMKHMSFERVQFARWDTANFRKNVLQ